MCFKGSKPEMAYKGNAKPCSSGMVVWVCLTCSLVRKSCMTTGKEYNTAYVDILLKLIISKN